MQAIIDGMFYDIFLKENQNSKKKIVLRQISEDHYFINETKFKIDFSGVQSYEVSYQFIIIINKLF